MLAFTFLVPLLESSLLISERQVRQRTQLAEQLISTQQQQVRVLFTHQSQDKRKWSTLHAAAKYNQPELAEMLIHEGADVNLRSDRDATPMHVACMVGNTRIMNIFLSAQKGRESEVSSTCHL